MLQKHKRQQYAQIQIDEIDSFVWQGLKSSYFDNIPQDEDKRAVAYTHLTLSTKSNLTTLFKTIPA